MTRYAVPKCVSVYPEIAELPASAGAVNVTVAWALPAVAVVIVGLPGVPATGAMIVTVVAASIVLQTCAVTNVSKANG